MACCGIIEKKPCSIDNYSHLVYNFLLKNLQKMEKFHVFHVFYVYHAAYLPKQKHNMITTPINQGQNPWFMLRPILFWNEWRCGYDPGKPENIEPIACSQRCRSDFCLFHRQL